VVVAESIYSVLGDAAPVAELVDLTRAQGAVLVIDEAHAVGVCGVGGRGLVAEVTGFGAGAPGLEHVVVTGTLSKSLAAQGGFVMSHPSVREHLVNTARPFIYDTGLAPAAAGAALGALDALASEPDRPKRLHDKAARLAAALGIDTPAGGVMSVPMPGPEEALAAVARAAEQGVRIGCFRPPSTPDGSSRLRLTANAGLSDTDLDRASAILEDLV
ncbi:MAG: aminotransferase class I/II-fold pyridoxal phosphate-dependent enzyme, partial [Tetrasphaera sp.]|nr:aminotransferase class I/II-fold pyridoxal phosphate-dependent enzyme [Tetrasphaera sp.]